MDATWYEEDVMGKPEKSSLPKNKDEGSRVDVPFLQGWGSPLELVCPSIVARSSGAYTAWAPEIPRNCIVLETLRTHEVQYDFVL